MWNGTAVKLFRVQETAREGPSLLAPRGGVDAIGSSLIGRLGDVAIAAVGRGAAGQAARRDSAARDTGRDSAARDPRRDSIARDPRRDSIARDNTARRDSASTRDRTSAETGRSAVV